MTALLAALALASQEATVTLSTDVGPIRQVLAQVQAQTGLELTADASVAGCELFFQVTAVPSDRLLGAIAQAARGKWRKTPKGMALTADLAMVKEAQALEFAERKRRLQQAIGQAEVTIETNPEAWLGLVKARVALADKQDAHWQEQLRFDQNAPAGRLVARLVRAIGVDVIAGLGDETRTVWSSDPTPMQRPFPQTALDALAAFETERAAHQEGLRRAAGLGIEAKGNSPLLMQSNPGAASLVTLTVTCEFGFQQVQLEYVVNGAPSVHALHIVELAEPKTPSDSPFAGAETEFVPSPRSRLLLDLVRSDQASAATKAQAAAELEDFESSTFPGSLATDLLRQSAGEADLVAGFDLSAGLRIAMSTGSRPRPVSYFWRHAVADTCRMFDHEGVTVVTDVLQSRQSASRRLCASFAKAEADGSTTMEELAPVAGAAKSRAEFIHSWSLWSMLTDRTESFSGPVSEAYGQLRVFDALPPDGKRAAKSGGFKVRVRDMGPKLLDAHRRLVFVHTPFMNVRQMPHAFYSSYSGLEPTILLPQGVPAETEVTVRLDTAPTLFFGSVDRPAGAMSGDASITADRIAYAELESNRRKGFWLAQTQTLTIESDFPDEQFHHSLYLLKPTLDPGAALTLAQLPEEIRKGIEAALPEARKAAADDLRRLSGGRQEKIKP